MSFQNKKIYNRLYYLKKKGKIEEHDELKNNYKSRIDNFKTEILLNNMEIIKLNMDSKHKINIDKTLTKNKNIEIISKNMNNHTETRILKQDGGFSNNNIDISNNKTDISNNKTDISNNKTDISNNIKQFDFLYDNNIQTPNNIIKSNKQNENIEMSKENNKMNTETINNKSSIFIKNQNNNTSDIYDNAISLFSSYENPKKHYSNNDIFIKQNEEKKQEIKTKVIEEKTNDNNSAIDIFIKPTEEEREQMKLKELEEKLRKKEHKLNLRRQLETLRERNQTN